VGIYLPERVVFEVSADGRRFTKAGEARPDVPPAGTAPLTRIAATNKLDLRARYVRVRAVNVGKIPPGRPGAGRKAWLFVDEVLVSADRPGGWPAADGTQTDRR
jgi:hexosaminidase